MKRFVLSLIAACAAAPLGWASTLAGPTYNLSVSAGTSFISDPSCSQSMTHAGSIFCSEPSGSASASESVFPNINLSAMVTGSTFGSGESADANVLYSFNIVGATPGKHIPVLISYSLSTAAGGDFREASSASATLTVRAQNDSVSATASATCGNVTRGAACTAPNNSGTLSIDFVGGEFGDVYEEVSANGSGDKGSASAFADPFIYVDPTFADAASYSVVVSPGVSNQQAAAPEPASLALAGGALLGGVFLIRRKRAQG